MPRSTRIACLALVALLAVAAAAEASSRSVSVPTKFAGVLAQVRHTARMPVLLPARVDVDVAPVRIFGVSLRARGGYDLELGIGRDCNGAEACFVAAFTAQRGGRPIGGSRVRLAHALSGRFSPLSCGGSCAPPSISWSERGVLYAIQYKGASDSRALMVALANSAIRGGGR